VVLGCWQESTFTKSVGLNVRALGAMLTLFRVAYTQEGALDVEARVSLFE